MLPQGLASERGSDGSLGAGRMGSYPDKEEKRTDLKVYPYKNKRKEEENETGHFDHNVSSNLGAADGGRRLGKPEQEL